jgi:uncharacterized protein (DUF1697 family)
MTTCGEHASPDIATYVALLRGINVGNAKRVAMADLREIVGDLGFAGVRTVLQSGNVAFRADPGEVGDAASRIQAALAERTGVQAAVLVLGADALLAVVAENPLLDVATDPSRLVVTFLAEPVDPRRVETPEPESLAPEVLRLGPRAIYQWCPDGVRNSKLPASFWRQLGPQATARNWRTVQRLADLVR